MAHSASETTEFAPVPARQAQAGARPFTRVTAFTDPDEAAAAWDELEACAPASPYQTRRWVTPWCRTIAAAEKITPLIVVAYDRNERAVALLPLGLMRRGPLRLAEFLGGKDANFTFGLFRPGAAFTRADLTALLRAARVSAGLRIDAFALVNQPLSWNGADNPMRALKHQPSPSFGFKSTLGSDAEAYVQAHMSNASRKKARKKERALAAAGKLTYVTARDTAAAEKILTAFAAQKAARMRMMGVKNVFADPAHAAFLKSAALENIGDGVCAVELHALALDEKIIATFGGAVHQGRFCGMFNSFDLSPEMSRSSPGDLLLMWLLRQKCAQGLETFDLGVGEARYKEAFCDEPEPLFDAYVALTPAGALLVRAKAAKRRLKRFVKTNPKLWTLVARMRKALG